MTDGYSSKDFTQPRFHYSELVLAAAPPAGAAALQYINQEVYKVSRPTLVDFLWISEETLTLAGGPGVGFHTSTMPFITVNWWVSDRARTDLRLRPMTMFDNHVDGMRAQIRLPGAWPAAGAATLFGSIMYRFRKPWRYNPGNSFLIDWFYEVGVLAGAAPPVPAINVVLYGVGVKSRHRRIFEVQMPAIAAAGPYLGSFTQPEFISNLADEPYDLDELHIVVPGVWADVRMFNMLRYRFVPSQGEPFSDDAIPILSYGLDMFPQGRGAIYAPTGGPMLLQPGQSIGWEIQNTATAQIRFQAVIAGRTAPNVYR